jgi:hypothetical protein
MTQEKGRRHFPGVRLKPLCHLSTEILMWPELSRSAMVVEVQYFAGDQSDKAGLFNGLTAFNPAA